MTEGRAIEIFTLKNKRSIITYEMLPDKCKFKWGKQGCEISKHDIDKILKEFFTNSEKWYLLDANVSKQRGGLGTYILNNIKGLTQKHASAVAAIMENEGSLEYRINGRNVELRKFN
ncbi:hypothetical protein [Clostridium sp. HBUAS56010]|uniref:hypothetical protein n=1 Tax=Clostridium sp. HBUAS56010 TaxID=2571127 RepID=UPI00117788D5|nr:hypothetical protein [Clostridium sp. HBUAS56010]